MQTTITGSRPIRNVVFSIATMVACVWGGQSAYSQILMEAPEDAPFYKLTNLQVTHGLLGEVITFDYARKRSARLFTYKRSQPVHPGT